MQTEGGIGETPWALEGFSLLTWFLITLWTLELCNFEQVTYPTSLFSYFSNEGNNWTYLLHRETISTQDEFRKYSLFCHTLPPLIPVPFLFFLTPQLFPPLCLPFLTPMGEVGKTLDGKIHHFISALIYNQDFKYLNFKYFKFFICLNIAVLVSQIEKNSQCIYNFRLYMQTNYYIIVRICTYVAFFIQSHIITLK